MREVHAKCVKNFQESKIPSRIVLRKASRSHANLRRIQDTAKHRALTDSAAQSDEKMPAQEATGSARRSNPPRIEMVRELPARDRRGSPRPEVWELNCCKPTTVQFHPKPFARSVSGAPRSGSVPSVPDLRPSSCKLRTSSGCSAGFDRNQCSTRSRARSSRLRKLRLLRAHGLIRKLPHTHRYLVTEPGRRQPMSLEDYFARTS